MADTPRVGGDPFLDITRALRAAENKVLIDINGGPLITAHLLEDFTYGLGNQFENVLESRLDRANGYAKLGQTLAAGAGVGQPMAQFIARHPLQTIHQWTGSDRYTFTLNVIFVATSPTMDVRVPINAIQQLTLPAFRAANFAMTAPNGYSGSGTDLWGNLDLRRGGVGVRIGKWFSTPQWFLVRGLGMVVSKTSIRSGFPLWASASIQFEAFRILQGSEVAAFFTGMNVNASNDTFMQSRNASNQERQR